MPVDLLKSQPVDLLSQPTDLLAGEEKKPLFEAQTPEEATTKQFLSRFVNTLGFGLPSHFAGKMGYEIPQPTTSAERVSAGLGELGGFIGGPAKIGKKIGQKLAAPLIMAAVKKQTIPRLIASQLGTNAISLGIANGLMTPKDALFAPMERAKQFGSGAVTGMIFGGMGYIPSRPARMLANMSVVGLPATLRQEPLEMQVFNYGLGAYFGLQGVSIKNQKEHMQKLGDVIRRGERKMAVKALKQADKMLRKLKEDGLEIISTEERLNRIADNSGATKILFDEAGISADKKAIGKGAYWDFRRKPLIERNWELAKQWLNDPLTQLRADNLGFVINRLRNEKGTITKSTLNKYTDKQLYAMKSVMENAPHVNRLGKFRPGQFKRPVTLWERFFKPGYSFLEYLGFGNTVEPGLTRSVYLDDHARANMVMNHLKLTNTWKRSVGLSKEVSQDLAKWADGKLSSKALIKRHGKTTLVVAKQIRQYYDILIDGVNKQLMRYGEEPIKKIDNYYTHFFEQIAKQYDKMTLDEQKVVMDFIPPPAREMFPFTKRVGKGGYVYDMWKALDLYSYRAIKASNDNFVRRAKQYKNYLHMAQKMADKEGITLGFDATDQIKNLEQFVLDYKNRPSGLDYHFQKSFEVFDKWIGNINPNLKLGTVNNTIDTLTGLLYSTQMGFRPKLALRNLGQHMLIVGQTGFKPLFQALSAKRTPQVLKYLSRSRVLSARQMGAVAEPGGVQKGLAKKAMAMFTAADRKNVADAYLSGYFQHLKKHPKDHRGARERGDQVAALTQFIYLQGNRSGLARGIAGRSTRPLSIFTSWPINYVEFIVQSAKPEHRANLMKYFATSAGFILMSALAGIKGIQYTGTNSPLSLLQLTSGEIPLISLAKRPRVQIFEDIKKVIKDEDLRQLLFYTLKEE